MREIEPGDQFQAALAAEAVGLALRIGDAEYGPRLSRHLAGAWLADSMFFWEILDAEKAKLVGKLLGQIFDHGTWQVADVQNALRSPHFSQAVENLMRIDEKLNNLTFAQRCSTECEPLELVRVNATNFRGEMRDALLAAIENYDKASDETERRRWSDKAWSLYLGA